MRFRKLRIAWSVAWGLLAVLLIVLWLRSQEWQYTFKYSFAPRQGYCLASDVRLTLIKYDMRKLPDVEAPELGFSTGKYPTKLIPVPSSQPIYVTKKRPFSSTEVCVPHWFPLSLVAILAAIPWIRYFRRFSYVGACQVTMGFTC
jgi:hypothetical protein